MSNKKVLNEVDRIKEVMGLLNEQSRPKIVKGLISVIDDLLGISAKNVDVLAREYGDDGAKLLKELSESNRGVGDILDDMRKLSNQKAFSDTFEGLKSAFDEVVDDSGISITEKINTVRRGVKELLDKGQKTKAAEYFKNESKKIAEFGDETIERFMKDEFFFNDIPNFSRADYNSALKLGSETVRGKGTVGGKVGRFMDTLKSYFKSVKKIEAKIVDDTDNYLKLKDEVSKLPIDDPTRMELIKRANRYLDRVDFNLGVLKRKNRETLDALIEEITQKRNSLPRTSPERAKLNDLIQRASKEDADVVSVWNYLPQGGYKPEGSMYQELKKLRQDRVDAIRKLIMPRKWMKPETLNRISKLSYGGSAGRFLTGNVGPPLKKLFTDPKKAPRILATEIGSRLFSIPLVFGATETLMDWIASMVLQDSEFMSEEWIKEHPDLANVIAGFGFDYKDYEDSYWATDFVINTVENTLQNFGITIPALAIKNWMDDNSKPGGGYAWWNQQFNKLEEMQKSESFKNASEEEKLKILEDIIEETDTWVTKTSSWWYDGLPPTVDSEINKVLAQIESETTTDDTEVSPSPNGVEGDNQQDDSSSSSSGEPGSLSHANEVFGGGVTQEGELFIYEGDKFKFNGTDYEWVP